jgi:hypothetical protein
VVVAAVNVLVLPPPSLSLPLPPPLLTPLLPPPPLLLDMTLVLIIYLNPFSPSPLCNYMKSGTLFHFMKPYKKFIFIEKLQAIITYKFSLN